MQTVITQTTDGRFIIANQLHTFVSVDQAELKRTLTSMGLLCDEPTRDPSSRTRAGDLPAAAQRAAAIAQGEAFDHDQA